MAKLTSDEIRALNVRNNIIMSKQAELSLLMRENDLFQKEIYAKYELDPTKKYNIANEVELIEVKDENINSQPVS